MSKERIGRRLKFSQITREMLGQIFGLSLPEVWLLPNRLQPPSAWFLEQLQRFAMFDFDYSEASRVLLIDLYLQEAIQSYPDLRVWKEVPLQTDQLTGFADYLITPRQIAPTQPFLCIIEAKRDDFERGMTQCVAELLVCQEKNAVLKDVTATYGIVTNGNAWRFYQLTPNRVVLESATYGIGQQAELLGALDYMLGECEKLIRRGDGTATQI
jgi:flagellar biosynthesis regulator FlbT